MAKSFAITTTATEMLRADAKGHAEAGFTVTNTTARPIRGLAKARPLGDTKGEWLRIQGEAERDFAPGATQQFTVSFNGPPIEPAGTTPAGGAAPPTGATATPAARKYPFRLDVESALNPDEDFTEGPTVTVEMVPAAVTPKKKFPLWILFVILGVVLLIGIVVLILVFRNGDTDTNTNESPTPTPVESPTATPTATPSPTSVDQEAVEKQCFDLVQGKISWIAGNPGATSWSPTNIQNLCKGTTNPIEPPDCFQRVMHGGTLREGRGPWTWQEALKLCAGTNDADNTISCYQEIIAKGSKGEVAIERCKSR